MREKLVVSALVFVTGLVTSDFSWAADVADVRQEITHASTYYWLGTFEQGNCHAFRRGLEHLDRASKLVDDDGLSGEEASQLRREIKALRADLSGRLDLVGDTFYGVFPLARLFASTLFADPEATGAFELYDDADEVAVERAAQRLRTIVTGDWIHETPLAVICTSDPLDRRLESLVEYVLHPSPEFEVADGRDVVHVLSDKKLIRPGETELTPDARIELFNVIDSPYVLHLVVRRDDVIDGLYSYALEGKVYDVDHDEPVRTVLARGLCRSRRAQLVPILFTHVGLLGLAVAAYATLVRLRTGTMPRWRSALLAPTVAFLIGRIVPWLLVPFLRSIAPDPEAIISASFWWPALLGIGVVVGPLLVCWLAALYAPVLRGTLVVDGRGGAVAMAAGFGVCAFILTSLILFQRFSGAIVPGLGIILTVGAAAFLLGRTMDRVAPLDPWWLAAAVFLSALVGVGVCLVSSLWLWGTVVVAASLTEAAWWTSRPTTKEPGPGPDRNQVPVDVTELAEVAENPPYQPFVTYKEAVKRVAGVVDGKTCWLALEGPPGCGKTATANALIDELSRKADARRLPVKKLIGTCDQSVVSQSPFGAFCDALEDLFPVNWFAPHEEQLKGVDQALRSIFESLVPFVNALSPSAEENPLAASSQYELRTSVARTISKLAKENLVLIFIDDAQWMDPASRDLMDYLLREFPHNKDVRVLIMMAYRDDAQDPVKRLRGSPHVLEVEMPDQGQQVKILRHSLDMCSDSAEQLVASLGKDTVKQGRLFWLFRAVAYLARSGAVEKTARGFALKGKYKQTGTIPLSDDLRAELVTRIEKTMNYRPILACAACIGQEFHVSVLEKCLGMSRLELLQALDQIERETGVIVDRRKEDDVYEFRSSFMLQVVHEELGITPKGRSGQAERGPFARDVPQLVREYHARVARVLEETLDDAPGEVFDVARHYHAAGKPYAEKGLEHCLRAARAARVMFEFGQAREFIRKADECARAARRVLDLEAELLLVDCQQSHVTGRQRRETAERAIAYLKQTETVPFETLRACARVCYEAGDETRDQWWFEQACRLGQQIVSSFECPVHRAVGYHFIGLGLPLDDAKGREENLQKALGLVKTAPVNSESQQTLAEVANSLAVHLRKGSRDDKQRAKELFEMSLDIKQRPESRDLPGQARSIGGLGRLALSEAEAEEENERWDAAGEYCETAKLRFKKDLRISKRIGDFTGQAKMHSFLGSCDRLLARCNADKEKDHLNQATGRYRRSWEMARLAASKLTQDKLFAATGLIECCQRQARLPEAADVGKELIGLAEGRPIAPSHGQRRLAAVLAKCSSDGDFPWIEQLRDLTHEADTETDT